MPPKNKAAPKAQESEAKHQYDTPPQTVNERSARVYAQGRPYSASLAATGGLSNLSQSERLLWANAHFARSPALLKQLGAKSQREVWKTVSEAPVGLPLRAPKSETPPTWGKDRFGADLDSYSLEKFTKRSERALTLAALEVQHCAFLEKRERERGVWVDPETQAAVVVTADEIEEEKLRRKEISAIKMELYGERADSYTEDPAWDDVIPMLVEDGEGALAAIAYPEHYAEAISYLRAVMAKKEYSIRCLRLTEHIISLNPAHYTVWLYRFSIIKALNIPLSDEIEWLNEVSLDNLKNYQIWHHRRLLMDHYYPTIKTQREEVEKLAKSEQAFLTQILAEDTKNYHVWSYRQYLVPKLGIFGDSELQAAATLINDDVRNNSAWSHRFFIVFSNPAHSTEGSLSTEHDPKIPAEIIDREVQYAKDKILLAPQNQSPWNYLRGVLVKGGRKMSNVEEFVVEFVSDVGDEDKEKVRSTHGLEMMAEIYAEKGDNAKADLCLKRLGERWDRVRLGYWEWRRQFLNAGNEDA